MSLGDNLKNINSHKGTFVDKNKELNNTFTPPSQEAVEQLTIPDVTTEGSLNVMLPPQSFFIEHEGRNLKSIPEAERDNYIESDLSSRRFGINNSGEIK